MTRNQLLDLGASRGLIAGRLESGAWVAVHQGVYCIGPRRNDPVSRAAAAVLACGPGAVLSHGSAASLWGFLPRWRGPMEVTTKGKRARPGILTHRCQSFQPRDATRQRGVPTTSRARTLLDVAPGLAAKRLTRLVNDARRKNDLRLPALQDVLDRNPLHPGTKLLRPFLDDPANPTASGLEDLFLEFIKKYDLPTPIINFNLRRKQPDAYFPEHNLIVELDGWEFHKDRHAFEEDRERDAENLRHGTPTIRITEQRLTHHADREAQRLQKILDWLEKRQQTGARPHRRPG
ncbi:MAG TPA: hypothetical protein VHW96_05990 [Solirubrobacteraceae bacterium]|nr:hypothetical protein [Solirubrobacteraceae bacterium]